MIRNLYNPAATDVDKKYEQMNESYYQNIKPEHMLDYFGFDTTAVSTQVAAVEAADDTYWYPLLCGQVDDVDATIDQFKVALETAGLQDIIDEAQRQVDEYVCSEIILLFVFVWINMKSKERSCALIIRSASSFLKIILI